MRNLSRSGLILFAASSAAVAVIGLEHEQAAIPEVFVLLLVLGASALGVAHLAAARRDRLGSLSRQFAAAVALVVAQMLIAVGAIAGLMFVSPHQAVLVVCIAAFAGVIAIRAAQLFAAGVLHDVEAVRNGIGAVGDGARTVRITTVSRADEVAELAAMANAMVVQLGDADRARDAAASAHRHLIAAVSHDLRTPITSLRLLADAVGDDIVDGDTRRRYLDLMGMHIEALSVLIADLFELSRLEAGEVEWATERVRVNELVGETVSAMRPQADAEQVVVVTRLRDSLDTARANPEKVQRVLFNLIQNAIQHTPPGGRVTVGAEHGNGSIEIEVADSGAGIDPPDRPHVFEPFYRGGSESARTGDGSGLGLAISRAIVEAHGGLMWLEDSGAETSLGTRIRFSLPRSA